MTVRERILEIRERIAAAAAKSGRKAEDITLLGVSKTVPMEKIREAYDAGLTLFGENRVQELAGKQPRLPEAGWHLIGHLQTNKVRQAVAHAGMIHSVDSLRLLKELDRHAHSAGKVQKVLVQVNISGEATKFGIAPSGVYSLMEEAQTLGNIRVCGLMTIPPAHADTNALKKMFENCNKLLIDIAGKKYHNVYMDFMSMGMSGDYETAILCGSNLVRIGSGIFGSRNYTIQ